MIETAILVYIVGLWATSMLAFVSTVCDGWTVLQKFTLMAFWPMFVPFFLVNAIKAVPSVFDKLTGDSNE